MPCKWCRNSSDGCDEWGAEPTRDWFTEREFDEAEERFQAAERARDLWEDEAYDRAKDDALLGDV